MPPPNHRWTTGRRSLACPAMRGLLLLAALGITCAARALGSEGQPPELNGAEAWLRVEDARWVEREAARFSAALGRDSRPINNILSGVLYRSTNLDGIDLSRPALLWWRGGPAPMAALIPICNRQAFLDAFGAMRDGDGPLVRVGDRDGTVIYSQAFDGGTREYRVLVVDEVAVVGRNLDECRKLAVRAGAILTTSERSVAPVSFALNGPAVARLNPSTLGWPARLPIGGWLDPWPTLRIAASWVIPQIESLAVDLRPAPGGTARMLLRLKAKPDSDLAAWLAVQNNSGSRLLTQVIADNAALTMCAHLTWRGRLEGLAKELAPALGAALPSPATPAWIESMQLMERAGDVVWCLQVPTPGTRISTLAIEQPRADEQARVIDAYAGAVLDAPSTSIAGVGQLRSTKQLNQVIASTNRHVVIVDGIAMAGSRPAGDSLQETTTRLLNRLQQVMAPSGEQAIFSLRADLSRLSLLANGSDFETIPPPAPTTLVVRTNGSTLLTVELTLPLALAAQALAHLPEERRNCPNR